jgi:hypothetical protein
MLNESTHRQIGALLDEAENAFIQRDWSELRRVCDVVLALQPNNTDALEYLSYAEDPGHDESGQNMDPSSSRKSGRQVQELAVSNSKLALEQSEFGEPKIPPEAGLRSDRRYQEREAQQIKGSVWTWILILIAITGWVLLHVYTNEIAPEDSSRGLSGRSSEGRLWDDRTIFDDYLDSDLLEDDGCHAAIC